MRRWTIVDCWRWFSSPTTKEKDENIPPAAAAAKLSCRFVFLFHHRPAAPES